MPSKRLSSGLIATGRVVAVAAMALLAGAAATSRAADVEVKLPYNIAYDLGPISIEVSGGGEYAIYDIWKHALAQGSVDGKETITFKPPRYGWYVVECGEKGADHFTSGTAKFIGVTPKFANMHTLADGESRGGWNDEALQAFTGLMLDRTNTRMGLGHGDKVLAACEKYGVTLLMQFESAPNGQQVREAVSHFKGRIKYWEVVNEPNFGMSPQAYAKVVKTVYPIIKEIDPQATVMGCDTCGIQLGWYDAFYKAGGGRFVDAISIHDYEGHGAIDLYHWNYKLGKLREIMAAHGDAEKPIWQTERAIGAAGFAGFEGNTQALRITMQRDILESWGVPNDHNNHYYVAVTGYNQVPAFVLSGSGPHQAALACRTRAAMIKGRKFVEKIDFGPTGNKIFLGLRYRGDDGQTITLRSAGFLDEPVEVAVSGGESVEVVDSWGNSQNVPVAGGRAVITVSQWPCYLRLLAGEDVKVRPWDFGKNIASAATFTYSGSTKRPFKLLTDGLFQDYFPDHPFGDQWIGSYTGKVLDDQPETLEIAFARPRPIQSVIVYGDQADNQFSAILDYDLQAQEGGNWVTLDEVRAPCPPSDVVETYLTHSISWYQTNQSYVHHFKAPVTTGKLRIVFRRITRGLFEDMIIEDLMNVGKPKRWHATDEQLHLREVEVYGPAAGGR